MRTSFVVVAFVVAAALLLQVPAGAAADAIVLVWTSSGAPPDVDNGVHLGANEAQRTAALLGRTVRVEPRATAAFATIVYEAGGVALRSGTGCTFQLAPTADAKTAALVDWKKQSGKDGEYRIAVWHPSLKQFGGVDLNERFTRQFHQPMGDGAWLGWVAVKASVEAALRATGTPCESIANLQFDGHKGASLSFRNGVLQQPLYVVQKTSEGEKVVAQVPAA